MTNQSCSYSKKEALLFSFVNLFKKRATFYHVRDLAQAKQSIDETNVSAPE
jgi:hypothetical protein